MPRGSANQLRVRTPLSAASGPTCMVFQSFRRSPRPRSNPALQISITSTTSTFELATSSGRHREASPRTLEVSSATLTASVPNTRREIPNAAHGPLQLKMVSGYAIRIDGVPGACFP